MHTPTPGVPDVCTHFIEVVPGRPLVVVDNASDKHIMNPNRMPMLPLDYEGKQLQVVTRAQLAPKALATPRVSATVHDGHGNRAYLPMGTQFEMVVVQEDQGQIEWVVARFPVLETKAEAEEDPTEMQATCMEGACHFAPIDLCSLRQKAEELSEASELPPLDFSDGCVYAVRVRARLPPNHPTTKRCSEDAAKHAMGLVPASCTRKAVSSLHAPSAGAGWKGDAWVLQTLTLVSFVVASAEDEELRRKQASLRSSLANFKGEEQRLSSAKAAADRTLQVARQRHQDAVAEIRATEARVSHAYGLSAQPEASRGRDRRSAHSSAAAPASTPLNAAQLQHALQRMLEQRPYKQVPPPAIDAAGTSGRSSRKSRQQQQPEEGHEAEGAWEAQPVIAHNARGANLLMLQEARDIIESSPSTSTVLGPVAVLFACERQDTALALSSYLGLGNLQTWIALDSKDAGQFCDFLKANHGWGKVVGLQDPSIGFGIPDPVDESHPQRPLLVRSQPGVEEALNSDPDGKRFGFIGYACNLVAIPPAFDKCAVIPDGVPGRSGHQRPTRLTLRQTLATYFFGKLMVFETAVGWKGFKAAMERSGHPLQRGTRLVGLDGTRFNLQPGMHEAVDTKAAQPQVMLGGVPLNVQLKAPLDARVKQLCGDIKCLQDACAKGEQARAAVSKAEVSQQRAELARAEFCAAQGPAQAQAWQEFERVQQELQRIQSAKRASGAQPVQQQRAQQQRAEAQEAMGPGLRNSKEAKRGSAADEEASRKQAKKG